MDILSILNNLEWYELLSFWFSTIISGLAALAGIYFIIAETFNGNGELNGIGYVIGAIALFPAIAYGVTVLISGVTNIVLISYIFSGFLILYSTTVTFFAIRGI